MFADCADIDDVIVFTQEMEEMQVVTKVDAERYCMEKNIIHAAVFKKSDQRTVYNMIYQRR